MFEVPPCSNLLCRFGKADFVQIAYSQDKDMFERDRLKKVASRSQSDADFTKYKQQQ